jgi:hypothetical protein
MIGMRIAKRLNTTTMLPRSEINPSSRLELLAKAQLGSVKERASSGSNSSAMSNFSEIDAGSD